MIYPRHNNTKSYRAFFVFFFFFHFTFSSYFILSCFIPAVLSSLFLSVIYPGSFDYRHSLALYVMMPHNVSHHVSCITLLFFYIFFLRIFCGIFCLQPYLASFVLKIYPHYFFPFRSFCWISFTQTPNNDTSLLWLLLYNTSLPCCIPTTSLIFSTQ